MTGAHTDQFLTIAVKGKRSAVPQIVHRVRTVQHAQVVITAIRSATANV